MLKFNFKPLKPELLVLSASPVCIGTAMAYGDGIHHWPTFFIMLLGALMLHIGINLPKEMKFPKILSFLSVIPACVYLILRAELPVGFIGVTIIIIGFLHATERFTLKFAGLDDILALLFFGIFTLPICYYAQSFEINTAVLLSGIAPGLFGVSIITIGNIRDIDKDNRQNKATVATKFGKNIALGKYLFSIICASLTPVLIYNITFDHEKTLSAVIVSLFAIPTVTNVFTKSDEASFSRARLDTIRLLAIYTMLFSWGWIR